MALLEVEDVAAGYGAGPDILRGLSLRIEQDRSYCIIGPNGAGKSTLLRVICGLLPARRGRVAFKGESLAGLRADQILRRGICFVPQDKSLFPDMTVKENVRMGGYILQDRREVERRVEAVFAMFPILRERARARPRCSPAASSRCCCSAAPWSCSRRSSCWTSPRSAWRPRSRARSSTTWTGCGAPA